MPDPVIKAYKADIDRTLLIENLKLSTQQRSEKFEQFMKLCFELRRNAKALQSESSESQHVSGSL